MKRKITTKELLNKVNTQFQTGANGSSGLDGSIPASNELTFTDIYLSDSQGYKSPPTKEKGNPVGSQDFKRVSFRIAILSYKGFFKDFKLFIGYRGKNNSIIENFYPIDDSLTVDVNLPLDDIMDLTQLCVSVRSKAGTTLKIGTTPDGLNSVEEIKVDFTELDNLAVFVNDQLPEHGQTAVSMGWISYNTQNIFY